MPRGVVQRSPALSRRLRVQAAADDPGAAASGLEAAGRTGAGHRTSCCTVDSWLAESDRTLPRRTTRTRVYQRLSSIKTASAPVVGTEFDGHAVPAARTAQGAVLRARVRRQSVIRRAQGLRQQA